MTNNLLYKNIFLYASLQFCGNIEEYFSEHTEKLVVFIVMPRLRNKYNLLRLYEKGKLIKEEKVRASENIFLYYFFWWWYQQIFAYTYFSSKESFILLGGHPICFFGMNIFKLLRKCTYAYFIGDYFPANNNRIITLFEKVKKHYHDVISYTFYLSDGINEIFNNGRVINTKNKKTIMWGVKPKKILRKLTQKQFHMLFVGLIKESQGLEVVFSFLKDHRDTKLSIIGICNETLYKRYCALIQVYGIQKQVYFPNTFFSDKELDTFSEACHVGIALYNVDKSNPTYYTDPGKVKAYAELGLPVVMSHTSAIAPYIAKFKAGEVIEQDDHSLQTALLHIKTGYQRYKEGLEVFNTYFYYESYYKEKFTCFENKV